MQFQTAVTFPAQLQGITAHWLELNYTAWWPRHTCVNNLPWVAVDNGAGQDSNPRPVDRKSSILTTWPPKCNIGTSKVTGSEVVRMFVEHGVCWWQDTSAPTYSFIDDPYLMPLSRMERVRTSSVHLCIIICYFIGFSRWTWFVRLPPWSSFSAYS